MHLFGWGERPVNRDKAYDYFCRANIAGCAAAVNNRSVCKWFGYGCTQNKTQASDELVVVSERTTAATPLRLMAQVSWCLWRTVICCCLSRIDVLFEWQVNVSIMVTSGGSPAEVNVVFPPALCARTPYNPS